MPKISSSYLTIILLSCLLFFNFGCKNSPTFNDDNTLDPFSKNYNLAVPNNIEVQLYENYNNFEDVVAIQWAYPDSQEKYIEKFEIFRSDTDTSEFRKIGQVSRTNGGGNSYYRYLDPAGYNGIHVWYKIRVVMEQPDGPLYAESEPISFSENELDISGAIYPFASNPKVELKWQSTELNNDINIEIYSKPNVDGEYNLEYSTNISDYSANFSLDTNQPEETEYYYKLVLDEIQTGYNAINISLNRPSLNILNSSNLEENRAELHIGFADSLGRRFEEFFIDDYQIDILFSANERTQFQSLSQITGSFSNPFVINSLDIQKENRYLFHIQGSRGNYKTALTSQLLNHKFHLVNTSTFGVVSNEIIYPNGSFNSSNSHFIISSDRNRPIIVDVNNETSRTLPNQPHTRDLRSVLSNFDNIKDAIITSSSAGNVLVRDPNSELSYITIPNFRQELSSFANLHPIDFDIISENELLIAYGDIGSETERVNNYYVTIWNSQTETHELIYETNEERMYTYSFKVAHHNNTILIFYSYALGEIKLVALNKDNLSIQKESSFSGQLDGWTSAFDIFVSNSGDKILLYSREDALQIKFNNHESISSIWDVDSRFYWYTIRGFTTAKDVELTCYGGNNRYYSSPYYSRIRCATNYIHEADILDIEMEGYLNGLVLSDDGTKLGALFSDKVIVYSLENDWLLTNSY